MKRIIDKGIPNEQITQDTVYPWVKSTVIPVLKEIRSIVNGRFGEINDVTTTYTITQKDEIVLANSSGGAYSVYLPPVVQWTKTIAVKRLGANNVTVEPNPNDSGVTIDAAASLVLSSDLDCCQLVSDGYNWYSISKP